MYCGNMNFTLKQNVLMRTEILAESRLSGYCSVEQYVFPKFDISARNPISLKMSRQECFTPPTSPTRNIQINDGMNGRRQFCPYSRKSRSLSLLCSAACL